MSSSDRANLELISLVWLDNMADATQENREVQDRLRCVVNHLRTFDKSQECEHYIKHGVNARQEKIILIASGRLGQEIADHIHDLGQVLSIFIYCFNKEKYLEWSKNYNKIRGVIVELNQLLQELEAYLKSEDQKLNECIELLPYEDEIIPYLLQTNTSPIDKMCLLKICKQEYENNTSEIENILEFEHLYSSSNALEWFFNGTFLYRLLMKALHICNIEMLFLLRFFLQDIDEQMKKLPNVSECVYRGQLLTTDQIDYLIQLDSKHLFRFNTFMTAYRSQENVIQSLKNCSNVNGLQPVLFAIEANQIGREYKESIIFPISAVFHVISVQAENRIRTVKIKVSYSCDPNTKKDKTPFQLAYFLRDIGKFDESEKLYNILLDQYPSFNYQAYEGLGRIAQDRSLYNKSLQFYLKALETVDMKNRGHCLNNIACAYDYLGQYEVALQYYFEALGLMEGDVNKAMCVCNMGITNTKLEEYGEARKCFKRALLIRENTPQNQYENGIPYANLGALWIILGEPDHALERLNFALELFSVNGARLCQAIVHQNIANIFEQKSQKDMALSHYRKAEKIFQQLRPTNHPNLIYVKQQIDALMKKE